MFMNICRTSWEISISCRSLFLSKQRHICHEQDEIFHYPVAEDEDQRDPQIDVAVMHADADAVPADSLDGLGEHEPPAQQCDKGHEGMIIERLQQMAMQERDDRARAAAAGAVISGQKVEGTGRNYPRKLQMKDAKHEQQCCKSSDQAPADDIQIAIL